MLQLQMQLMILILLLEVKNLIHIIKLTITITTTIIIVIVIIIIMKKITTIKVVLTIKLMALRPYQPQKNCIRTLRQHGKEIKWFLTKAKTES